MLNSFKEGILEINEKAINSDLEEPDQETSTTSASQTPRMVSSRDLQGYSETEVKDFIKKELTSLRSSDHDVYDPAPPDHYLVKIKKDSLHQNGSLDLVLL